MDGSVASAWPRRTASAASAVAAAAPPATACRRHTMAALPGPAAKVLLIKTWDVVFFELQS